MSRKGPSNKRWRQRIFSPLVDEKNQPPLSLLPTGYTRPAVVITLLEATQTQEDKAQNGHLGSNSYFPVFVTTSMNFPLLNQANCAIEFLQPLTEIQKHLDVGPWPSYLQARWQLIRSKWHPKWIVHYGISIDDCLKNAAKSDTVLINATES